MMTINNKSERKDLCWPVTSHGSGYGVSTLHRIIFCRKNDKFSPFQSPVSKVNISLISMMLFSRYVLVQSTFSRQFKMEINQHQVNTYLATKNVNILFSLTFVILPLV